MEHIVNHENSDKSFSFWHYIDTEKCIMDFHSHNFIEIYLSISGGDKFVMTDKIYEVNPYDLFIVDSLYVHKFITKDNETYERYVLEFKDNFAMDYCTRNTDLLCYFNNEKLQEINKIPLGETLGRQLQAAFAEYEQIDETTYGADVLKELAFVKLLTMIAGIYDQQLDTNVPKQALVDHGPVSDCLKYIEQNYRQDINLDTLAEHVGFSKYHLCKLFKQEIGTTINTFIIKKRVATAKYYLLHGHTVTETCERSGFNDLSHFIRTFKKEVGVSPRRYVIESPPEANDIYVGPENDRNT